MQTRERSDIALLPTATAVRHVCAFLLLLLLAHNVFASPSLTFSPSGASFGTVVIGETKTLNVRVTNQSAGTVAITDISIEGFSSFSAADRCPAQILAGASCMVQISFHPVSGAGYHGDQSAVIVFHDGTSVIGSLDASGHAL